MAAHSWARNRCLGAHGSLERDTASGSVRSTPLVWMTLMSRSQRAANMYSLLNCSAITSVRALRRRMQCMAAMLSVSINTRRPTIRGPHCSINAMLPANSLKLIGSDFSYGVQKCFTVSLIPEIQLTPPDARSLASVPKITGGPRCVSISSGTAFRRSRFSFHQAKSRKNPPGSTIGRNPVPKRTCPRFQSTMHP